LCPGIRPGSHSEGGVLMTIHSALCSVRVGRDREVETLRTLSVTRRMTLITGPAGIGKSQLSLEALRIAREEGLSTLVGNCTPELTLPFAPFVNALRRRTRRLEPENLAELFGGSAALSATLLPEVARSLDLDVEPQSQDDLFASIWQLLRRLASAGGCILLLEDLHWADSDTLGLMSYLSRELEGLDLWIVGTFRADEIHRRHPLVKVLAELSRERRYEEIALVHLTRAEIAEMVRTIFSGTDVDDEFIDALFERTIGNPFFIEEMLRVLIDQGDLYQESGGWARRDLSQIELPMTVRETLLTRVRSLQPHEVEFIHVAAVAGQRLDLEVLAAAIGQPMDVVEGIVGNALALQLLSELHEKRGGSYGFRHAVTREALIEEMVGADRRLAHRRVAQAIEQVHGGNLQPYVIELADHYHASGSDEQAIKFGRQAAAAAAASFAIDEAGRLYGRTLALLPDPSPERVGILLDAATIAIQATDRRLAVSLAAEARGLAHASGDRFGEMGANVLLARDRSLAGDTPGGIPYLREALELVRGVDEFHEAMARDRLARDLTRIDRVQEALALLAESFDVAERSSNYESLVSMHVTAMLNSPYGPEFEQHLEAGRRAARQCGSLKPEFEICQAAGYVTLWCGDFTRSMELFTRALDLRESFLPHDRYTEAGYAWLLALMGRYDESAAACSGSDDSTAPTRMVALTALCEIAQRRADLSIDRLLDEFLTTGTHSGETQRSVPALSARARRLLTLEGASAASSEFWNVLEVTTSARGRGSHWLFSPDYAMALAREGDEAELARWAEAVGAVTENDPQPHNRAADALVQGLVKLLQRDFDAARELLSASASGYRTMGCPAREVEALIATSNLERRVGDFTASSVAAERALAIASGIGASTLEEQATQAAKASRTTTVLTTVLFTDLVNSTVRLAELGDREWKHLLELHDAAVRRQLDRHAGREIKTTGDGFLATFDTPAEAIRCARGIRQSLESLGIEVRVGVHTGQCDLYGDDIAGIAVNLAARVCARGEAGQILVTSTVRDLVAGAGISLEAGEVCQFKGVPGDWQIFLA
jgi:class 3 adenylate cyclase